MFIDVTPTIQTGNCSNLYKYTKVLKCCWHGYFPFLFLELVNKLVFISSYSPIFLPFIWNFQIRSCLLFNTSYFSPFPELMNISALLYIIIWLFLVTSRAGKWLRVSMLWGGRRSSLGMRVLIATISSAWCWINVSTNFQIAFQPVCDWALIGYRAARAFRERGGDISGYRQITSTQPSH